VSSLADRVRGIVKQPSTSLAQGSPVAQGFSSASDVESVLGGTWCDGCFIVERRAAPNVRHGRETVGALSERLARSAGEAALFATGAPRPPFIFFDLETTGLNGGAGTQAFLVGCGRFSDDGAFATRQFLLTRVAEEQRLLAAVRAELARAGAIVTFNGKTFDAPLLETRYLFHRLQWFGDGLPHVDVLHPARRFWGSSPIGGGAPREASGGGAPRAIKHSPECSLIALERRLLGAKRVGDVPGFEVPSRYFQFVRTGDARPLAAVLDHNRQDLLTLASLTARLLHLSRVGPVEARDAAEALALGRTYARAGQDDRARDAFVRAVAMSRAPAGAFDPIRIDGLRSLALAWRRARHFEEAAQCWRQLSEIRGCPPHIAREAAEALAIHHEHRVRDLAAARQFVLRSLDADVPPAWTKAVQHRLARIDRKISERPLSFSSSWRS
jgi:hypothetical protein